MSVVGSIGLFFVGVSIIGAIASGLLLINGLLLVWVNAIVASAFLYMAFKRTSLQFNVGLFNTGALVYLIGEALTIVLVGFLIALVGQIMFAIAFFSLPSQPVATQQAGQMIASETSARPAVSQTQQLQLQKRNFCAKCGMKLEPRANYCPNCGVSNSDFL